MFAVFSSVGTLLVISMLLSVVTFAVGCAVGAWFFRSGVAGSAESRAQSPEAARSIERMMMASARIHDLAKNVVSHVGDHGNKVEAFNSDLKAMAGEPATLSTDTVLLAIGQMTYANTELQQRLTRLEKQIGDQAVELRSYGTEVRTDSLTGLANRRAFDDEVQRRFAEWQRRRTPFTLLILDVDHFKQINDSNGHPAGDAVLRHIGTVIATNSRQMDFRCRYGGDEFVVILPDTTAQEARVAAERIRKALESAVIPFENESLSATCSIGVARIGAGDDVMKLIRRADEALYKAKEAGRNCGFWHDGSECLPLVTASTSAAHAAGSGPLVDSLADRNAFLEALTRRVPESQRFGIPLSIIHLRIENYGALCQAHGESAARTTLDAVTSFTQLALRQIDLLARLDDGEFAVLLPGSTRSEANQIAKRLQMSAANCDARLHSEKVRFSMSHGIAEFHADDTAESMMSRAKMAAGAKEIQQEAVNS